MEIGIILAVDFFILLFILANIPLYLQLCYRRNASDDYILVTVYAVYRLLHYSMKIPALQLEKEGQVWPTAEVVKGQESVDSDPGREQIFVKRFIERYVLHPSRLRHVLEEIRKHFIVYRRVMNALIGKLTCVHLTWRTRYGLEDAALVGILYGVIWSGKSLLLKRLGQRVAFSSRPVVALTPIQGSSLWEIDFDCIFTLKLGNLITAIGMMVYIMAKEERHSGRTSDTRLNEDGYGKYQGNG
ncbi:DUF2953 domain-containing protein [Propionispora hippei]|uniref:DUF2953 domain-containing protein n=1 Tax=Propionispora hippei DSM 15287 TaxID=1123003 RepID=A0A1M6ADF8_9FIRM|nr:DUF2953 domain-containing protein [Propionispora hippei]SHI34594.1 Protein of unknown function [Propionispora hippei DSM 15287]